MSPPYEQSVFINCPFDKEYSPILQALAFCITDLGLYPRIAPENSDNATPRLERIIELIRSSKFGIHDLSRCKASRAGEFARLNMPFELGICHGARLFGGDLHAGKVTLVLEECRYDYQKALSDIAGWDIHHHTGDYNKAVRIVRNWLAQQLDRDLSGTTKVLGNYVAFQEWYWERESAKGASEDDIREYPTVYVVRAMRDWLEAGRPVR